VFMISINDKLKYILTFQDLDDFVKTCYSDVTFMGSRVVKSHGYSGTIKIDDLAKYFLHVVEINKDYNETQREIGKKTVRQIDRLYTGSEKERLSKNLFTRIMCVFRDWIESFGTPPANSKHSFRRTWKNQYANNILNRYSRVQCRTVFGRSPPSNPDVYKTWSKESLLNHFIDENTKLKAAN
ncbi:MAG: hypothetical protein JHC93_00700, partial [Parachlamydiales bacterium]|nr:hypothetical protein [Parachlamydiales bacterium]